MTSRRQTLGLTLLALIAFAANSIFCRLALHAGAIDAMSFTSVRLLSGALRRGSADHDRAQPAGWQPPDQTRVRRHCTGH